MGATRSKWRGGQLAFYDGATYETVLPLAPIYTYDDFLGTAVNADVWTEADTNLATKGIALSNLTYTLTNDVEVQDAGLQCAGLPLDMDKGPIFECRMAITTAPTDVVEMFLGFTGETWASDQQVAAADDIARHALFVFDGGLTATIYTDATGGPDNNAVATGHTAGLGTNYVYRIDATSPASVKFYVNGVQVAATTTFVLNTVANMRVSPIIMATKAGGGGVCVYTVDYIRFWQATR